MILPSPPRCVNAGPRVMSDPRYDKSGPWQLMRQLWRHLPTWACGAAYCPAERRRANFNDELPGGGGVEGHASSTRGLESS